MILRFVSLTCFTFPLGQHASRNAQRPLLVSPLHRHGHVDAVLVGLDVGGALARQLLLHALGEQLVARRLPHLHHPRPLHRARPEQLNSFPRRQFLEHLQLVLVQVLLGHHVRLVGHDEQRLVLEEGADVLEQLQLRVQVEPALLAHVEHVHDGGFQVGQRGDGQHLVGGPLGDGLVQQPRRVDDLPLDVPVVHVADVQGPGGVSPRLHFHLGAGQRVNEAGLAHVGKSCGKIVACQVCACNNFNCFHK